MNQHVANEIGQVIKDNVESYFWDDEHYQTVKDSHENLADAMYQLLTAFDPTINKEEFKRACGYE